MLEEINDFFGDLREILLRKFWKIISYSAAIFLAFPIIKWLFISLWYILNPSETLLNKLTISTFVDNFIPWYLEIFIEPLNSLGFVCAIILLVTTLIYIMENF